MNEWVSEKHNSLLSRDDVMFRLVCLNCPAAEILRVDTRAPLRVTDSFKLVIPGGHNKSYDKEYTSMAESETFWQST